MEVSPWQVVVVPFPFTERRGGKRRPALVLSRTGFSASGHALLAMITTHTRHPWPGDTGLQDLSAAGLRTPSTVRLKLFTLDRRLILRSLGRLSRADRQAVARALRGLFV